MPFPIDLAIEHDAWTDDLRGADTIEALADRAVAAALAVVPAATVAGPHGTYPVTDGAELSIVLCDDSFIRTLNAKWRGKDTATNVLSFPAPAPMRAMTLGDIVVAYETSAREAAERGMPLADYLAHLIVHGVLHLVGLDHDTDAAADRMEALESRALATLGIASPYDRDDAAPASGTAGHDRLEGAAGLRATT